MERSKRVVYVAYFVKVSSAYKLKTNIFKEIKDAFCEIVSTDLSGTFYMDFQKKKIL